ncbi:tetratricopeptide repeat protein [Rasiella sp. SM2506]|uniref:tetratricopeptide repeat protein n=1 Tax=Rasiella sp. SM2506 TaxID=3423914 RepID=UPI003D79BF30
MDTDAFFINNLSSVYQNPDQTEKVAKYFLENATSSTGKVEGHYLFSMSAALKGNAAQSIEELFNAKDNLTKETSPLVTTLVYSEISERYSVAGMESIGEKFERKAKIRFAEIIPGEKRIIAEVILALNQSNSAANKDGIEDALQKLLQIETNYTTMPPILMARVSNKIADLYLYNMKVDLAKVYFEKALSLLKTSGAESSSLSAISYHGLGNVYFEKDELEVSKQYYKQTLAIPFIEKSIKFLAHKNISEIYKRQDSTALLQKYYNEIFYSIHNFKTTNVLLGVH